MVETSAQAGPLWIFIPPSSPKGDYETPAPSHWQEVGRKILDKTSRKRDLRFLTGFSLSFDEAVGRLLRIRELAIENELEGFYTRSGFFWRMAHRLLRQIVDQEDHWNHFVRGIEGAGAVAPDQVREAFIRELFVGLHVSLFRGFQAADPGHLNPRAGAHLDWALALIDRFHPARLDEVPEVFHLALVELQSRIKKKDWRSAWTLVLGLAKGVPNNVDVIELALRVSAESREATLKENQSNRNHESLDADSIGSAIQELKVLRGIAPNSPAIYQQIGELHALHAVKLANTGEVPEALLAIQKAVTFHPGLEKGWKLREQLLQMMAELKREMEYIEATIAAQPNASLNAQGQAMKRKANIGASLMEKYEKSEEAEAIQTARRRALARAIWTEIGLNPTRRDDQSPVRLLEVLEQVAAVNLKSLPEIRASWQGISRDDELLSGMDANLIVEFLADRMIRKPKTIEARRKLTKPIDLALPAPIAPRVNSRRASLEPFRMWLFAPEAILTKALAAFAIIAFAVTVVWGVTQERNRRARDSAYSEVIAGAHAGDYETVLNAAEHFLAARITAEDAREPEVLAYYNEAFVRWFTSHDPTTESGQRHLDRYKAIAAARPAPEVEP